MGLIDKKESIISGHSPFKQRWLNDAIPVLSSTSSVCGNIVDNSLFSNLRQFFVRATRQCARVCTCPARLFILLRKNMLGKSKRHYSNLVMMRWRIDGEDDAGSQLCVQHNIRFDGTNLVWFGWYREDLWQDFPPASKKGGKYRHDSPLISSASLHPTHLPSSSHPIPIIFFFLSFSHPYQTIPQSFSYPSFSFYSQLAPFPYTHHHIPLLFLLEIAYAPWPPFLTLHSVPQSTTSPQPPLLRVRG